MKTSSIKQILLSAVAFLIKPLFLIVPQGISIQNPAAPSYVFSSKKNK